MDLDPVLLSRLQFAWVIGWHILLPAFTIGMAAYITILEGMHLVTGRSVYLRISMYWIRIFSVAFGVGVVTGVVMPFRSPLLLRLVVLGVPRQGARRCGLSLSARRYLAAGPKTTRPNWPRWHAHQRRWT